MPLQRALLVSYYSVSYVSISQYNFENYCFICIVYWRMFEFAPVLYKKVQAYLSI